MDSQFLYFVVAGIPFAATVIDWLGSSISERHHSHHDTYEPPATLFHCLVMVMIGMGLIGVVTGILIDVSAHSAKFAAVMAFFAVFEIMLFALWHSMRRYRVVTYGDHMVVTPFVGRPVTIPYDEIEGLRWSRLRVGFADASVHVYARGRRVATLWDGIDVDQVLTSINRFDLLEVKGAISC